MDRRMGDRRARPPKVEEPLQRAAERRREERRDSPRATIRLWVRDPNEGGVAQVFDGVVSLGGVSWMTRFPPRSTEVEIGFRVPDHRDEVRAKAVVMRTFPDGQDVEVQATFTEIDVLSELKLARWLGSST